MFGIIFGTLCLFLLVGVITRERHYRRHGYPMHGHHARCGGCGYHHHHGPHSPPVPPQAGSAQPEASV